MIFIDLRTAVFQLRNWISIFVEEGSFWFSHPGGKKIIHFQFYFLSGILLSELLFVIFGAAARWIKTVYSTVQPGSEEYCLP